MARDTFVDTVGLVDTDGTYKPLANIQVNVYVGGTTTPVTLYAGRTGATQKTNPFTTLSGGGVEFWVEAGDYDIKFHDLTLPARIGDKTIGFQALNGGAGGIPSSKIAGDAGLPYAALDAVAARQDVPIGGVIDWFRPDNTVAVPTGWVICDGTTVLAANHDFGTGANFATPDLRNAFVLGANISNADGSGGTASSDAAASAPGIRGSGGSHARDLSHGHSVSGTSGATAPGTGVASADHNHGINVFTGGPSASQKIWNNPAANGSVAAVNLATADHFHGINSVTGGRSADHTHTVASHTHTFSATSATQLSATTDIRPKYIGLLKIMKVKRN